jgi:hypothetical protein
MPLYQSDIQDKRTRYETIRWSLWGQRQSGFDAHWRDLSDFLLPRRTRFWPGDRNRGDKRNQNIIDSTARFAVRTLASGLHAGLTSPARPWLKLTTPDPQLAEFGPVKEWLHVVTQRMLIVFAESNLYNVLPLVYADMGVFGTGAMSIVADSRDLFRAASYPVGSYALGQNNRQQTSTFVREYQMTVRQIVEEFGVSPDGRSIDWTNISRYVKDLWERGDYETGVDVVWMVKPNEYADATKLDSKYMPFASCHFELSSQTNNPHDTSQLRFLRESGFTTFPIMAPRWDVTGEDSYGTDCPGMTALGDIKQLQIMQKRKGQAISKMVDPPLVGPASLRTQKTSLLPGDITYVDAREGMQGLRSIHEVTLNIEHLGRDIGEVQYRIQRAFYEDLFLMLARSDNTRNGQPVTAREIDERHEEKLLALGPVLERTNDELLDPLVDRVYELMEKAGLLPTPPQELNNVKLRVEYISIMAQAQKLVGVAAQDRFLQSAASLVEVFPEIRLKVIPFQVVDNYADMLGVDPRIVRPTDEAQAMFDEERKAAQAQANAQQAVDMAKATKLAGDTPLTGDTVLSRMVSAAPNMQSEAQP